MRDIRTTILIGLVFMAGTALAQYAPTAYPSSATVNYVRSWAATAPGLSQGSLSSGALTDVKQSTQYLDGLGRPIQSVAKRSSPLGSDMVSASIYDALGRETYSYLPFASTMTSGGTEVVNDGRFKTDPFQQQAAFYGNNSNGPIKNQGESYYYGQVDFEASPLNRPLKNFAAGNSWEGSRGSSNEKSTQEQYLVNTAADSVQNWTIATATGSVPAISTAYAAGTLNKTVSLDESGKQLVNYSDMQGRVVLKKVQSATTPGTGHIGWLCTYYIYDDFGNLRYVLQPLAVQLLESNGTWSLSAIPNLIAELCFRYEYDARKRMSLKKVPGAGEVWEIYDARDRPVLVQDANLRASGQWLFTKYDSLNRPVMTGTYTDNSHTTQASMQAYLTAQNMGLFETYASGPFPQYSLTASFPSSTAASVLSCTYYDSYSWVSGSGTSITSALDGTGSSSFATASNTVWPYPQAVAQSAQTIGMPTGSAVKVLNGTTYLYKEVYYDDHNRTLQTQSINISGGRDIATVQYAWDGQPLNTLLQHQKSGANAQTHSVLTQVVYDGMGRLLTTTKTVNSTVGGQTVALAARIISTLTYNELGQPQSKILGNSLETLAYDYNIRGWLLGVNRGYTGGSTTSHFGFELGYDKAVAMAGTTSFTAQQFNGNISGSIWKSAGDGVDRKYDYTYDNLNRLSGANFLQNTAGSTWDHAAVDFTVGNLQYDANGNILSMNQMGIKIGSAPSFIDQLSYTYQTNSNKLQQVSDASNDNASTMGDFKYNPSTKTATDYNYDANGNLASDANKNITAIGYNILNLPQGLTVTAKGNIQYVYDAAGNKLQKVTTDNTVSPAKITTTTYIGGIVYVNDTLQFIGQEEGRFRFLPAVTGASPVAASFVSDYFIRDHLGNTRMVLTDQVQKDVYPAATLESIGSPQSALAAEQNYYAINPSNVVANTYAVGITAYPNNNGFTFVHPSLTTAQQNSSSQYVYRLNSSISTAKMGLGKTLRVMAGDKLDIFCESYYNQTSNDPSNTVAALDILAGLFGAPGSPATGHGSAAIVGSNTAGTMTPLSNFLGHPSTSAPKAYVNYIFFDEQMNFVSGNFSQVSGTAVQQHYTDAQMQNINVPKNGYVYIYCSNETDVNVFFDNLQVVHTRGPILEETHYYPFGLTMAGISSKASGALTNKLKYNGNELQSGEFSDGSGLETMDFNARMYDAQIGRFWQTDPWADRYEDLSPYAFVGNNPISYSDHWGLGPDSLPAVTVVGVDKSKPKSGQQLAPQSISTTAQPLTLANQSEGQAPTMVAVATPTQGENSSTQAASKAEPEDKFITTNNLIGSFGFGWGAKENLLDYAAKSAPAIEELKYFKAVKLGSKALLVAQVVVSTAQAISAWKNSDRNWRNNNGNKWGVSGKAALDVTMGVIGTFGGPVGWAVSGGYFLGDTLGLWGNWGEAPKTEEGKKPD